MDISFTRAIIAKKTDWFSSISRYGPVPGGTPRSARRPQNLIF